MIPPGPITAWRRRAPWARVSMAEYEANLAAKLADPAFGGDLAPLLATSAPTFDVPGAIASVRDQIVARIHGAPWKGTGA